MPPWQAARGAVAACGDVLHWPHVRVVAAYQLTLVRRWNDTASRARIGGRRSRDRQALLADARRGLRQAAWRAVTYGDNDAALAWWSAIVVAHRNPPSG